MSHVGKVYLIDDDSSLLRALSRRLTVAGYQTETFQSAAEFLEHNTTEGSGCIVLDLMMPGMNGLEFQQALHVRGISLPIIFLTGHGTVPAASVAFKAGAVDFLTKPVRSQELLAAVSDALERHLVMSAEELKVVSIKTRYSELTPRESEVCSLMIQGLLNKQIGHSLGAAEATVKKHRGRVFEKMSVQSVAELVTAIELMNRHTKTAASRRPRLVVG
jgi:FixJ family two-component response regulator